jgi:hypothetical protein
MLGDVAAAAFRGFYPRFLTFILQNSNNSLLLQLYNQDKGQSEKQIEREVLKC